MRKTKGKAAGDVGKTDSQQGAVYTWEGEWFGWNTNQLTLPECRQLIRAAVEPFDVATPKVTQHWKRSFSWFSPDDNLICLQARGALRTSGKNASTCLHEAAHVVMWDWYRYGAQDHGPTFMAIYLSMMIRAQVAPASALFATARKHRLKWRPLQNLCRPV